MDLVPTGWPFSALHHRQEVCTRTYPEPGPRGWLETGPICLSFCLSPQGLQNSYSEEYLRTLLCQKKLKSR